MFSEEDLKDKPINELEKMLKDIDDEIEELDVERKLTIGGTGQHIGVAEVERIRSQLDREKQRALDRQSIIIKVIHEKHDN